MQKEDAMKIQKLLAAALAGIMGFANVIPVNCLNTAATAEKTATELSDPVSDMTIESTNSFGSLLASELTEKQAEQLANNGCNIFSVEMDGNEATVSYQTVVDCTLVIGIYDESGTTLYATGTAEVTPDERETTVTIETDEMPQYFYVKGYLADSFLLNPLCTVYENPEYTKNMQEFNAKTVNDFEPELVLNLDEDPNKNFAVYNENVILIPEAEDSNIVTENEDGTYLIENADDNFLSRKSGDIVSYTYGEDGMLIAKIGEITIDGTTVTIVPEEITLDDVFQHVNIDASGGMENADVTPADGVEVVESSEVAADVGLDATLKTEKKLKKDFDISVTETTPQDPADPDDSLSVELKISGCLQFSAGFSAKLKLGLFVDDYIELKIDYLAEAELAFTEKLELHLVLGHVDFSPVAGVYVSITPSVIFKLEGSAKVNGSFSGCFGIRGSKNGLENISEAPAPRITGEIDCKFFVGFDLQPECTIVHKKVASASLNATVGLELDAKQTYFDTSNTEFIHYCKDCIDGSVNFVFSVDGKLTFMGWFMDSLSIKLVDIHVPICDFYYSSDYGEFGLFAECPHRLQKVCLTFKNKAEEPVEGVSVSLTSESSLLTESAMTLTQPLKTDKNGQVRFFLGAGKTTVKAEHDSYDPASATLYARFNDEAKLILNSEATTEQTITLPEKTYPVYVTVVDNFGMPMKGARLSCEQLGFANYTDADGKVVLMMPAGVHDVEMYACDMSLQVSCTVKRLITVVNSPVEENFVVERPPHVRFVVTDKDGQPVPASYIILDGDQENEYFCGGSDGVMKLIPEVGTHTANIYYFGSFTSKYLTTVEFTYTGEFIEIPVTVDESGGDVTTPTEPGEIEGKKVVQVSLGGYHSAAITADGSLYIWGDNFCGQLGDGTHTDKTTPVKIMDNVASVSLGGLRSAAITTDGSLYTWGSNGGLIGDGTTEVKSTPVKIMDNVASVSLGDYHSAAITTDGSLYTWGDNEYGQLGDGTTEDKSTPVKIMDNVASVSLGDEHSAAITTDGSLYTWGYNLFGQLGDGESGFDENGDELISTVPIKIMDNAASVSLGWYHSAAITTDGSLYTWGRNYEGQLGDGTATKSSTPVKIMDNVASVSLGYKHSAAITTDGSLYTWGDNYYGQLGNGTAGYTDKLTPVKIMDNVASVSLEYEHSAAITIDGSLYTWGDNGWGQLGDGTTEDKLVPTKIIIPSEDTATVSLNASALIKATSGETPQTSLTGLEPDTVYNYYVLFTDKPDMPLVSANIQYITQFVSGSDGTAEIDTGDTFLTEDAIVLAVPTVTTSDEPTEPDPTEPDPTETEPSESDTTEPVPTEPEPTETDPTEPDITETEPTETQPTETEPTETQPTETEPAETQPTEPAPTEPEPTPADILLGDVNLDNTINAGDAAMTLSAAAAYGATGSYGNMTDAQITAADIDGNEAVNASDAAYILQYAAIKGANGKEFDIRELVK